MKQVISATRRSDLVACYPEKLVEEVYRIGLEHIYTLVIWTKNPQNILTHQPLNELLSKLDQVYLNLTTTGLGGSLLEPNVPDPNEIFHILPEIIDLIGSSQRIAIRFDPRKNQIEGRQPIASPVIDDERI